METGTDMPVNELTQGPEQESELSASIEQCLSLAQEILASIDEALSKAQSRGCPNLAVGPPDSPPSPRSPRSEITGQQPFEDEGTEMISKKRRTRPKWTSRVKLGAGPEAEGPLDDGYSWRKYGQKDLLGAKYPRGYYRCTHRNSQGCLAMKQAQRSDDNPAIFNVTYRGTHTCDRKPSLPAAATSSTWTSLMKLGSRPEAEGPLDDGYTWRNYGQKDLPGAKYPRCYYKCTQRLCPARKQVQQSDDNPAIFNVTYVGTHKCNQKPSPPAAATSSKWTSQVKLGSGPEAEGPLDDGYTWRKYGQKDLLGAKYPRAYYMCEHRKQGCLAKKQVQQSDDNPAIFDVTYKGTHKCCQKPSPPADATSSFLCSSPPSTLDNSGKRSFTEAFTSSVTSELNCFSSSPGRKSRYGETPSLHASDSFPAMVSTLELGNNFSVFDLDFPHQSSDSDPEVPF